MTRTLPHRFHTWRHRRPFGAGLLTALAGAEILLAPVIGVGLIINTGLAGTSGFLLGIVLIGLGLVFWTAPAHRTLTAVFTIAIAFAAFLTTNLGGFLIGHLLALAGAAAGIAWTPATDTEDAAPRQV
ncbi:DUF6114 domain-containing protein [Actinomadura rudentiformis]|uniref:Integral membrane protein n=1 Tax=Actinomadura rudentiformis TaxID=359158 RepID=A0A6H9Z4N8_9ACTN|nr:DUF6114 domain-containing protein [Actinomadura rudentiformis]KAB2352228.1 hypothetical protein F8566_00495 [Actinomadura rudentiformis]